MLPSTRKLLITRKHTGLGSDLISVIGALHYASMVNRDIIIDWRKSLYLNNKCVNLFPYLFDLRESIYLNSRIMIAENSFSDTELPVPRLYSKDWPFEEYHIDMLQGKNREEMSLIVERPMHHLPDQFKQCALLKLINPKPLLRERIDIFRNIYFTGRKVVGVHIRHGNGEILGGKRKSFSQLTIKEIHRRATEEIKLFSYNKPFIFLCTDSPEIKQYFRNNDKNIICYDTKLRTKGKGPLHTNQLGLPSAEDAIIEMYLLSYCNSLVYNPSWFSHFARIVTTFDFPPINIHYECNYGTMAFYHELFNKKSLLPS
jgi:hypothetical protein